MPEDVMNDTRRQQIFRGLVEAQDGGMSVEDSRVTVATSFGISEAEVRRIESEGLDKNWPPL